MRENYYLFLILSIDLICSKVYAVIPRGLLLEQVLLMPIVTNTS